MPKSKKTDSTDEYENLKYQIYTDERKLLIATEQDQAKTFDKYILTLSSGALGLSLAFIKIIKSINPGSEFWLVAAWVLFSLSTLSTLISFLTSQIACRKQVDILEASFFPEDKKKETSESNHYSTATGILNITSITLLILGVSVFIIFATQNIKTIDTTEDYMSNKFSTENVTNGMKPPQSPKIPMEKGVKVPNIPKEPPKPKK
jgi:hypothetical protein